MALAKPSIFSVRAAPMRFPDSEWFERRATAKYHSLTGSGNFIFHPR